MPLIANTISDIIANADAPMKAITAYFHAFIDGKLDSLRTHAWLVGIIAVAEISLGAGIWLESPKHKTLREWIGVLLVLGGCLLSVIATVGLLIFDEGISRSQNDEIIGLRKLTATRDITLDDVKRASAKLAQYSGQPAKIVVFPVNFESDWIASRVYEILSGAHWKLTPPERLSAPPGNGGFMVSGIWVDHSDDQGSLQAADDLRDVLNSTIAVAGGRRVGPGVVPGTFDPSSPIVWIFVGDKPAPLSSWVAP
jgi:hypothetical protein